MGSRGEGSHRHKKKRHRKGREMSPDTAHLKLLKYIGRGDGRKLGRLLEGDSVDINARNSLGQTVLHEACRAGRMTVVELLLQHGANADLIDSNGNTPGHVAALHGHTTVLLHLLKGAAPPNIDRPNAQGATLRALVQVAITRGVSSFKEQQAEVAVTGSGAAEWRDKLREADSDDDGAAKASWADDHHTYRGGSSSAAAASLGEDDDAWADRLWREMRDRRKSAAAQSAGAFRSSLREDAAAKASAAREESDRILREERAKDAQWRSRLALMPGMQAIAVDAAAQRASYEAAWAVLDAQVAAAAAAGVLHSGPSPTPQAGVAAAQPPLRYADIPWPVAEDAGGTALRDALLHGADGSPADVKRRLRAEILRWHPDKFGARLGWRLAPGGDAVRVVARVREVSQMLTQLLAGGI